MRKERQTQYGDGSVALEKPQQQCITLALGTLGEFFSRRRIEIFFSYFSQKAKVDIGVETICVCVCVGGGGGGVSLFFFFFC